MSRQRSCMSCGHRTEQTTRPCTHPEADEPGFYARPASECWTESAPKGEWPEPWSPGYEQVCEDCPSRVITGDDGLISYECHEVECSARQEALDAAVPSV